MFSKVLPTRSFFFFSAAFCWRKLCCITDSTAGWPFTFWDCARSEEHTSELQSHVNLVCRLLLEKKISANAARLQSLLLPALATLLLKPLRQPAHPSTYPPVARGPALVAGRLEPNALPG